MQYAIDPVGQPIPVRSILHIQQAYTEIVNALFLGLYTYTTGDVIILNGCVMTGTDPGARTMTAGAIYYNGEIYLVPAASFSTTGLQIPVWTINTSFSGAQIVFTDGTARSVQQVIQFVLVAGAVGGAGVTGYVTDYNNARVKPFSPSRSDRNTDFNQAYNTNSPTAGGPTQIGNALTTANGINKNYKLEFTWSFNKISTDPEMYMGFYKNGTLLAEYHHLADVVAGHSLASTIHHMDLNVPAGTVYTVKLRVSGSTNQYTIQSYAFSIDGQA